ncbi:MAG: DsbA family protein [Saprospiraceae bacterium]|jgi:putative protein-disulfide isomerase|nr:DsbA family protein [Saprospiraceae bacterium]
MKAFLFTVILTSFIQIMTMAQVKPKVIYFGDPMCSWCYGFSPEFSDVIKDLEESVDFQFVMGGLRPYNTQKIEELADFLKEHWEDVHESSGQPFGYEILEDMEFVYDTEPACRATVTMRQLSPKSEFEFFKAIQKAFYHQNKHTNKTETYLELVEQFGVRKEDFKNAFESEEMREAVRRDFEYSSEVGVRGFPTVVLQKGDQYYLIANGYMKSGVVIERIKKQL